LSVTNDQYRYSAFKPSSLSDDTHSSFVEPIINTNLRTTSQITSN
jgi:hypothetical protein